MTSASREASAPGRRSLVLLAALTTILLLPFAGKPFHVDDTLFLKAARQIRASPLDFYGFSVNWYGIEQPMWEVTKNPPLASYFIAFVTSIAGESELALHLAFLVFSVAAVTGTYRLARRFCAHPLLAALTTLSTPAFLVSSTNVMCDTMLLAFWVWSLELWVRGLDEGTPGALAGGALLSGVAALTKYFGVAIVPLLFAYSLARTRRIRPWAPFLLLPLAILAAYQWATLALYGRGLAGAAAEYASVLKTHGETALGKGIIGLAFTGGSLATVAFFVPVLWRWRTPLPWVVAAASGLLIFGAIRATGGIALENATEPRGPLTAQLAVLAAAGVHLLWLAASDLRENRDAPSLLLFLWVAGTILFGGFVNWTTSARNLLPIAPAVGILVMRRVERGRPVRARTFALPLTVGACLSFLVAAADLRLAENGRTAARRIVREFGARPGTLWFQGHWGFQFYMEAAGAKPLDRRRSRVEKGDRLAIPTNNSWVVPVPESAVTLASQFELPPFPGIATVQPAVGAGFYSDSWGPLPFVVGRVPPERYFIFELIRDDVSFLTGRERPG